MDGSDCRSIRAASLCGRISNSLGKKITYYGINDTEQEIEAEQWKDMRIQDSGSRGGKVNGRDYKKVGNIFDNPELLEVE